MFRFSVADFGSRLDPSMFRREADVVGPVSIRRCVSSSPFARQDPFAKVKSMITNMVSKLEKEKQAPIARLAPRHSGLGAGAGRGWVRD